jgi:hypothetical protein
MSFDKETRNLLARTIAACRRRLVEDVTGQLRGTYGLHPDGTVLPLDKLTHLSPDQIAAASRLRDLLNHYAVGATDKVSDRNKAAYERMVLEISFTTLNRLAALRLCEERGLVAECVRRATASDGFRVFESISGGVLGGRYDTYQVFLECLFDELAVDLGVLFDRMTPQSTVFPTEQCMEDVLAELNKPELVHLWTEDETIGWVYQYFNPPEERKAMRDASQAPRNSRELAVRNQFFTPRYVVEFLTDNTLGRIWYEMRKGDTVLEDECRYLVRRPNEVFLAPGEAAPVESKGEINPSQEELLRQIVYIEHRSKKDPRDIKILDPACGSGHFLLYAFDLLERIYQEAWADPDSPESEATNHTMVEDFETLDELRRAVPKLIIEHNIHGIDIDPRCVQIAALALWLRAQKTWKNLHCKAIERPRIIKSNIVIAEPMPGDASMQREFAAGLRPQVLGQVLGIVFETMKLAGEAGALLKIEEEIANAIATAKRQWLEGSIEEQLSLLMEDEKADRKHSGTIDVSGVKDDEFWERAEDRILMALREYAERAAGDRTIRHRLFAEDAAMGFSFIDLCRKHYDVVLMNPPFGLVQSDVFGYLERVFPDTYIDIYAAFVCRGISWLARRGLVGSITSRSFITSRRLERWRRNQLISSIKLLVDLGGDVMDNAMIKSAASIFSRDSEAETSMIVVDVSRSTDRSAGIISGFSLDDSIDALQPARRYFPLRCKLATLPGARILYFLPASFIDSFVNLPRFEPSIGTVRKGLTTFDDFRFLRLKWEVPEMLTWSASRWEAFGKGGEYANFYTDIHLVVNRQDDGAELAEVNRQVNGQVAQSRQASSYYYRPGSQYSGRSQKGFSARAIPSGCVMNSGSPMVLSESCVSEHAILGWLNSRLIRAFIEMQSMDKGFPPGILKTLPWPDSTEEHFHLLESPTTIAYTNYRAICSLSETDPYFVLCCEFFDNSYSINDLHRLQLDRYRHRTDLIVEAQADLTRLVDGSYGIDSASLANEILERDVVSEITEPPIEAVELAQRLLSLFFGSAFGRWDARMASDLSIAPKLPGPFDPLPVCPPGMLVGSDGLPAETGQIVSREWLRARPSANTLPPWGSVRSPTIPDSEYPLRIAWDGILVDDPGFNDGQQHKNDIIRRVREVLDLLWKDKAHEIEQEACEILGVSDLRDYFRKPSGFFKDHLKRYSKSRRQAPIYWPLSTASGSYTLWLYYHRLTDQTLYAAVNSYVEPKIAEIEHGIARIESDLKTASGRDATRMNDRLSIAGAFLGELRDFREKLLRIAALPYKPNLNDGVIINSAPLNKLFRLKSWADDTLECWKKLEKGEYDWAHLAYTIWPDRVRKVCKKDRSIAIAHGLEDLCEIRMSTPKKRGRKAGKGVADAESTEGQ